MKTKITTIIGLVALGMISFTTNHATAANRQMSSITTVETQDNLTIENCMQNANPWTENAETKTAKAETVKSLEAEGLSEEDFLKAAESYTASGSNTEVNNYVTKLIALEDARKEK